MTRYYAHASGLASLHVDTVMEIAEEDGRKLVAIDGLDIQDLLTGKERLPRKRANDTRDYLFIINEDSQVLSDSSARHILYNAKEKLETPLYSDVLELLEVSKVAEWGSQLRMATETNLDSDCIDIVIYIPGKDEYTPPTYYYRGDAGYACRELINHFAPHIKEGQ